MAPRRTAGCLLGLLAALAAFQTSTGFTTDLACPTETFVCLGDADCSSCLETLQAGDISFDVAFTDCNELYAGVCTVVEDAGCDITNSNLESFAACIAEEEFGCPDFVSCDAVADPTATTVPTPAAVMTDAPTAMTETPAAVTGAPTAMTETPAAVTGAPTDMPAATDTLAPSTTGDAEDAREANEDSGVSRTVAAAATRTAMAFACGLALFLSV